MLTRLASAAMRRFIRRTAMILVLAGAGVTPAFPQGAAGPAAARARGQLTPGEVSAMLDAYAAVQAQQALALDDQRYGDFLPRLKALQEARRKARQGHGQALQELRRLTTDRTSANYDEAAVRDRLKALRDLDERSAAEVRRAADAVDQVLDLRQQARFRLFEEMIERRKLDLVLRARQRARKDASLP